MFWWYDNNLLCFLNVVISYCIVIFFGFWGKFVTIIKFQIAFIRPQKRLR